MKATQNAFFFNQNHLPFPSPKFLIYDCLAVSLKKNKQKTKGFLKCQTFSVSKT